MNYRQILDSQVKSKANYPVQIPLEPHLDNRYYSHYENNNTNNNNASKFYIFFNLLIFLFQILKQMIDLILEIRI